MTKLTITTPKGAVITLDAGENGGMISASVNGKKHTSFGVKLAHDSVVGHHLMLSGNTKAAVKAENVEGLREFFRDQAAKFEAYKASRELDAQEFSASIADKMSGRYSDN